MNQNCTCGTNYNIHPKFTVYHTGIVFDERAGFVESVCATLIESRYGPGRASQLVVKLSDRPETESAVFFELSDGEMVPSYALSPMGRCGYQVIEAGYRRAKQMGLMDAKPNVHNPASSPPHLGRGSP